MTETRVRDFYEKENSEFFQNNPGGGQGDSVAKANRLFAILEKNHIIPKTVAEIGCGAGGVLEQFQKLLPEGTVLAGYDIAMDAMTLAKPKTNENMTFHLGNLLDVDIHVDLLIMADVFEHVEDYYGFLQKSHEKSDYFLFSIPLDMSMRTLFFSSHLRRAMKSTGHLHFFTEESALLALEHTGFDIIDTCYMSRLLDFRRPMSLVLKIFYGAQLLLLGRRFTTKLYGECILAVLARSKRK